MLISTITQVLQLGIRPHIFHGCFLCSPAPVRVIISSNMIVISLIAAIPEDTTANPPNAANMSYWNINDLHSEAAESREILWDKSALYR